MSCFESVVGFAAALGLVFTGCSTSSYNETRAQRNAMALDQARDQLRAETSPEAVSTPPSDDALMTTNATPRDEAPVNQRSIAAHGNNLGIHPIDGTKSPQSTDLVQRVNGRLSIRRASLVAWQQGGPHRFIQSVRVKPSFRGGHFFGWRILAYGGPGKLNRGDIVRRINGRPVERPDEFMQVWDGAASRDRLVIEVMRGNKLLTFAYPIRD